MINTTERTEIDSLKIRIPYNKISVINYKLESTMFTFYEGGELVEEFKKNALLFDDEGIKTRFAIEVMPTDNKGASEKFLTIGLNSKLLKSLYFEGITKDNIDIVHKGLMAYKVAEFSLQTLLEGFATDIDFKTDLQCTLSEFEEIKKYFMVNARSSSNSDVGYKPFSAPTNKGIQFSNRLTKSFKTNPFFKIYWKPLELRYKSATFFKTHLQGQNTNNIARFETTIKNNKHLKVLGITSNTLSHLLNLDDSFKKDILKNTISIHLDSNIKKIEIKEGMSPMEQLLHNLIVMQMEQGMSYDKIRDFALSNFTDKIAKSRKKSQLNKIYEEHIKGTKKDISTKNIASIFSILGINGES